MVKIKIEKKYLYFFSIIMGIALGVIAVYAYAPAPATANPASMGHSINEIDGTGPALSSFTGTQRGSLTLNVPYSNGVIQSIDFIHTNVGNPSNPVSRIASRHTGSGTYLSFGTSNNYASGITNEALTIAPNGNVGIGATNPASKLDVNGNLNANGDIYSAGKIFTSHTCTFIDGHSLNGVVTRTFNIPNECIDSKCLIAIGGGSTSGASYLWTFVWYQQTNYAGTNGASDSFNRALWFSEGPTFIKSPPSSYPNAALSSAVPAGANGNSNQDVIMRLADAGTGLSMIELIDDLSETSANQLTWRTRDLGASVIICK